MSGWTSALPTRPPAVDFIETHLADIHDTFKIVQAKFDPASGRYVPTRMPADAEHASLVPPAAAAQDDIDTREAARLALPVALPMRFWTKIFPKAMNKFKQQYKVEPTKALRKSHVSYSIRSKNSWAEVYEELQKTREVYDGEKKGFWGRFKQGRRWIIVHAGSVRPFLKFVPDMDYVSPVLAAVEVLLDAFEVSSKVRNKMTDFGGKDIERHFGYIEIFLATFPEEHKIEESSVELVAATFKAVEDAMVFFLKNNLKKMLSSVGRGKDYQKPILDSLDAIPTCSQQLIQDTQNISMASTKIGLDTVMKGNASIILMHKTTKEKLVDMNEKIDSILEYEVVFEDSLSQLKADNAQLLNYVKSLLDEVEKLKNGSDRLQDDMSRLSQKVNSSENTPVRVATPTPDLQQRPAQPGMFLPPSPHLLPYMMLLPNFYPTAGYLQPQLPIQDAAASCASMSPTAAPPPPEYSFVAGQPQGHAATRSGVNTVYLRRILHIPDDMDETDIVSILERSNSISIHSRTKSDRIVRLRQFRRWIATPTSRELLVHGEFGASGARCYISALSLLCATVMQALRDKQDRYISMVFFCGSHIDESEDEDDEEGQRHDLPRHCGGRAMIRSLLAQLLRQRSFDAALQQEKALGVDIERARKGNLTQLCALLEWLIRQLPADQIMVCIIDSISHYETDELESDMLKVLDTLLRLARDEKVSVPVKILVTSPTTTDAVHRCFFDDSDDEDGKDEDYFITLAESRAGGLPSGLPIGTSALGDDDSGGSIASDEIVDPDESDSSDEDDEND